MSPLSKDAQAFQGITVQELVRRCQEEPALQQRLVVLLAEPQRRRMTYEEFLAWADEDTLAEWVDGEVVMYSPASSRHQKIVGFLSAVIGMYVRQHELGVTMLAPFQMKLPGSGREPDLIFVAAQHVDRLRDTYLDGPADLAIEVLSPESVSRDRGEKFYEYARGGVPEYWLIDPGTQWVEFYRLGGERYRLAFEGQVGQYHSVALPGFWLRVEWLWQDPLPNVEDVLLEIGGDAYARSWIERLRQRGFLPEGS